jgi:hypothetical protein
MIYVLSQSLETMIYKSKSQDYDLHVKVSRLWFTSQSLFGGIFFDFLTKWVTKKQRMPDTILSGISSLDFVNQSLETLTS